MRKRVVGVLIRGGKKKSEKGIGKTGWHKVRGRKRGGMVKSRKKHIKTDL